MAAASRICLLILFCNHVYASGDLVYHCEEGQMLTDVFGEYGPLCDGNSDCKDGSDEKYCEAKTFTGCWSVGKNGYSSIVSCDRCLCTADVRDCSVQDFVGQDCHYCLTETAAVGDGDKDCINGIDESDDAKILISSFGDNWRAIMRWGEWRCPEGKKCGAVMPEKRKPYLASFTRRSGGECLPQWTAEGNRPMFVSCGSSQCVREECGGAATTTTTTTTTTAATRSNGCGSGQWPCEGGCLRWKQPCNGRCYYTSNYYCATTSSCLGLDQPCPELTCPNGLHCPSTGACLQSHSQPCGQRCLSTVNTKYCWSKDECILPGVRCEDCPIGSWACGNGCILESQKCLGNCKFGLEDCRETCQQQCHDFEDCIDGQLCSDSRGDRCVRVDESCNGLCLPGRRFCGEECVINSVDCNDNKSKKTASLVDNLTFIGIGVAVTAVLCLVGLGVYRCIVARRRTRKASLSEPIDNMGEVEL